MKELIQVDDERIVVKRLYVYNEEFIQQNYKRMHRGEELPTDWTAKLPAMEMEARVSINNSPFIDYRVEVDHSNDQMYVAPERHHLISLCEEYSKGSWHTTIEAVDDHFDDEIYKRLVFNG